MVVKQRERDYGLIEQNTSHLRRRLRETKRERRGGWKDRGGGRRQECHDEWKQHIQPVTASSKMTSHR